MLNNFSYNLGEADQYGARVMAVATVTEKHQRRLTQLLVLAVIFL